AVAVTVGRSAPAVALMSGKPGTLLCPAPLRTGRASFPASGSSKPCWLVGGQKRWAAAVGAAGVYETVVSLVRHAVRRLDDHDRRAGGRQPCLPIARGLWLVGEERRLADRTAPVLGLEQPPVGVGERQDRPASSPSPVFGQ